MACASLLTTAALVGSGLPAGAASGQPGVVAQLPFVDRRGDVCVIDVVRVRGSVSCADPGSRGFRIVGIPRAPKGEVPTVANVGDVNGDGIDDFAVGVPWASFDGRAGAGVTYVVFGGATPRTVDVADLGTNGFEIGGAAAGDGTALFDPDQYGGSLTPGDANGDGVNDILVGAVGTDNAFGKGPAYVVFGKASDTPVDLAKLGPGGFEITGTRQDRAPGPLSFIGDVNGDGRDDIGVYAPPAVVFGKADHDPVKLGALGAGGLPIRGLNPNSDHLIAGLGDVNGGRIDGFAVGDWDGGRGDAGMVYVVYGRRTPEPLDVDDLGTRGYVIAHGSAIALGISIAGLKGASGQPELAISDNLDVRVVPLHAQTPPVDLREPGLGYTVSYPGNSAAAADTEPVAPGVFGDGAGDLVVDFYVYRRAADRFFVLFPHSSQRPIDVTHLGDQGFEVVGAVG